MIPLRFHSLVSCKVIYMWPAVWSRSGQRILVNWYIHVFSPPIFSVSVISLVLAISLRVSVMNYQLWKQSGVQMFEERDDKGRLMHRRRFVCQVSAITVATASRRTVSSCWEIMGGCCLLSHSRPWSGNLSGPRCSPGGSAASSCSAAFRDTQQTGIVHRRHSPPSF